MIARLGILLGALAFWLTVPPVATSAAVWPIVVGAGAVACGLWARGRLGWLAVAAGVLGASLGVLAEGAGRSNLGAAVVWSSLVASMLVNATPLTYAALGGLYAERSGVVNIGLEGMMLTGAFFGIWGADVTGDWALGLAIAVAAGGALALGYAFFAIHLRTDQIIGGTAVNFLALGITGYLFVDVYGFTGTPALRGSQRIPDVTLSNGSGFFAQAFGSLNLLVWLSFLALGLTSFVVFRTPLGLRIRAVGEHPRAADTVGIDVYKIRYGAVVASGMLAAAGGAFLSIGFLGTFTEGMTSGRGYIALAAMIFGNWRPFGAAAACLLFGFSSALADRLPAYSESAAVLFSALPYVLTLIAVAGVIGRSIPPAAAGKPYQKQ